MMTARRKRLERNYSLGFTPARNLLDCRMPNVNWLTKWLTLRAVCKAPLQSVLRQNSFRRTCLLHSIDSINTACCQDSLVPSVYTTALESHISAAAIIGRNLLRTLLRPRHPAELPFADLERALD